MPYDRRYLAILGFEDRDHQPSEGRPTDVRPTWCSNHHVVSSKGNRTTYHPQRKYFDSLPQAHMDSIILRRPDPKSSRFDFWKFQVENMPNKDTYMGHMRHLLETKSHLFKRKRSRAIEDVDFNDNPIYSNPASSFQNQDKDTANSASLPGQLQAIVASSEASQHPQESLSIPGLGVTRGKQTGSRRPSLSGSKEKPVPASPKSSTGGKRPYWMAQEKHGDITEEHIKRLYDCKPIPGLREVADFYLGIIKSYGTITRWWVQHDKDLNMQITTLEFIAGLQHISFDEKLSRQKLLHFFDHDDTKFLHYRFIDPAGAIKLAQLRGWCHDKFGGVQDAFKKLDRDGNGKLTVKEFKEGVKRHGLPNAGEMTHSLFGMLDCDGNNLVQSSEVAFLDKWKPPPWLTVTPDHESAEKFTQSLLAQCGGNPIVAWRTFIGLKNQMRITHDMFCHLKCCKEFSKKQLLGIWRALDPNLTGWLSLINFHAEAFHALLTFKKFAADHAADHHRKDQNKKETVPAKVKAKGEHAHRSSGILEAYDVNESGMLNREEFFKKIVPQLHLTDHQASMLFDGLDHNFGGTIKLHEMKWLDEWDATEQEERENLLTEILAIFGAFMKKPR